MTGAVSDGAALGLPLSASQGSSPIRGSNPLPSQSRRLRSSLHSLLSLRMAGVPRGRLDAGSRAVQCHCDQVAVAWSSCARFSMCDSSSRISFSGLITMNSAPEKAPLVWPGGA